MNKASLKTTGSFMYVCMYIMCVYRQCSCVIVGNLEVYYFFLSSFSTCPPIPIPMARLGAGRPCDYLLRYREDDRKEEREERRASEMMGLQISLSSPWSPSRERGLVVGRYPPSLARVSSVCD